MYIVFYIVFGIVFILSIEIYSIYQAQETITENMYRACNVAMESGMIDSYRKTHIGRINKDVSLNALKTYLQSEELICSGAGSIHSASDLEGSEWRKEKSGKTVCKIKFTDVLIYEGGVMIDGTVISPEVSLKGNLYVQSVFMKALFPSIYGEGRAGFWLPVSFHSHSKNAANVE
ncbi:MAG: hypothetical protein PUF72_05600 [Clostridiales bacterium]|nr:hypothetical protein [Clostridiales bacterium]